MAAVISLAAPPKEELPLFDWAGMMLRLAGAIAHHFNNQLGMVIGNLEMAIEDLQNDITPAKYLYRGDAGRTKSH
jgi:hypothetical protein